MAPFLKALTHRLMRNRRRHPRHPHAYQVLLYSDRGRIVFRGKTGDVSRSGARILGYPVGTGVYEQQEVRISFLLIPKDADRPAKRAAVYARIRRVSDNGAAVALGVQFLEPLAE